MYSRTTPFSSMNTLTGKTKDSKLVRHFVVSVQEHRKCMAMLHNVLAHFRLVFQLVDGQHDESLLTQTSRT
jgi:hypothetical protein